MITSLQLRGLTASRGPRRLFDGLGASVAAGEALAVTGANGSGKTSLLRVIAGLLRPDGGEVHFAGSAGDIDADEARREGLHMLGHQDGLKASRTAGEELSFQARWTGASGEGIERAVETLALKPLLGLEVRMLSAGQRRRLALGRLVASPRTLWLLDEPFAPLDVHRRATFGALMAEHLAGGGMVVAAVHDPLPVPAHNLELAA